MTLIADALLIAGALAAAFYCWILSARVKSLKDLDNGLGAAIAALSGKVDEMQTALRVTQKVTGESRSDIEDMTSRAEKAATDLSDILSRVEAAERRTHRRENERRRKAEPVEAKSQTEPAPEGVPLKARPVRPPIQVANEVELQATNDEAEAPSEPTGGVVRKLNNRRTAPTVLSNAEKLQREIRDRLADRERKEQNGSDDVVKTIQSLLVAARQ